MAQCSHEVKTGLGKVGYIVVTDFSPKTGEERVNA